MAEAKETLKHQEFQSAFDSILDYRKDEHISKQRLDVISELKQKQVEEMHWDSKSNDRDLGIILAQVDQLELKSNQSIHQLL